MDLFQFSPKENSNFKMMGVINITPNSFSDGGKYTSLPLIKDQINHFRNYGCKCFDFGAESTAPFNKAITKEEEQKRLGPLFELIKSGEFRE
uniref:dihydropteroate synthase n=1 Tax=Halobacteriovorax sp. TaxID=2020862 RepID=UPI00356275FA